MQPEIAGAAVSRALALTESFVFTPQTFCEVKLVPSFPLCLEILHIQHDRGITVLKFLIFV